MQSVVKICAIADTHGLHEHCKLTGGDLLIHAGDITEFGTAEEVEDFLQWFARQPFTYKVFIAGNHDLYFEENRLHTIKKIMPENVHYLCNSGITIGGLKIWGSPVSPYFLGMAFNKHRGTEIKKVWNKIPAATDILITHTPPYGILDNETGCEQLTARIMQTPPRCHIFGHIHGCNGAVKTTDTLFVNAAVVNTLTDIQDTRYKIIAKPVQITYNHEFSSLGQGGCDGQLLKC